MDFDDRICHLVETMADVYSFVQESDPIQRIKPQCQIVSLMTQQTTECAYFIRDYLMRKNFCMLSFSARYASLPFTLLPGERALRNSLMSDVSMKIQQYETKFSELTMAFQNRAVL